MKRIYCLSIIVLSCLFIVNADIQISGKVVDSNNNPIENATVCLATQSSINSKTDQSGNFSISDESSTIHSNNFIKLSPTFNIKNQKLIISSLPQNTIGNVSIYSITGKRIFASSFQILKSKKVTLKLPLISTGHYILILKCNNKTYPNKFLYLKDNTFLFNNQKTDFKSITPLTKKLESIDTLIASKDGFDTSRIPISSYNQDDITITLYSTNQNKGLTIYFIRHAETVANASGEQGGGGSTENHDSLTTLGKKQVTELTEFLIEENITPDHVIVSPTIRTQKTIDPFLEETGLTGHIWAELNECCGYEPTGDPLPTERPEAKWKVSVTKVSDNFTFDTDDDQYYWWPSTYEEGLFMVMTARDKIIDNFSQSGKSIIVVGHAVNGNILLNLLRGYDMLENKPSMQLYLMNTTVNVLTEDPVSGKFTIKQNIHTPPRE